jgi:hypothetical protein
MNETRNIKDSVFVALFNNEAAARELYNAINGTDYGPETPVTMTTLDDVLCKGIKNDVSFTIDDTYMALFEHQSSFNRNLPLRIFLYIAHVYDRLIPNKELHKDKQFKVPRPYPVVLYTGKNKGKSAMKKNRMIMRLSESFLGKPFSFGVFELEVLVINLTPGFNKRMLQRSPLLRGYVTLINRFRENMKTMPDDRQAALEAVDWCIANDVLADFCREHRKELDSMLLNELTNEAAIEAAVEETREETWKEAWKEASEATLDEVFALIDQGLSGEKLKRATERYRFQEIPKTTRTKSSKL